MINITPEMSARAAQLFTEHYDSIRVPKDIGGPGDPNAVSYFLLVEAAVETGKVLIGLYGWGAGTILFNHVLSGAQTGYVEYLKANGIAMSADFHSNVPPSAN